MPGRQEDHAARHCRPDLRTWGWVTLILGGLQVLAALGVMARVL
jgi:hypothetical protein